MDTSNKLPGNKKEATVSSSTLQPRENKIPFSDKEFETLRKQLKDKDLKLRSSAADKLQDIHDLRTIPWLVEAIRDEMIQRKSWLDEYEQEIELTGGRNPIGGSDALRRRMDAIKTADVSTKAEYALCLLGPSAIEPIIAALIAFSRSKDWHIRSWHEDQRDLNIGVRNMVAGILGKALWKIDNLQALDPLVNALSDEDWRVRFAVVIALGSLGNPRAIDPLAMLLTEPESDVRFAADQAIETLKKLEH